MSVQGSAGLVVVFPPCVKSCVCCVKDLVQIPWIGENAAFVSMFQAASGSRFCCHKAERKTFNRREKGRFLIWAPGNPVNKSGVQYEVSNILYFRYFAW